VRHQYHYVKLPVNVEAVRDLYCAMDSCIKTTHYITDDIHRVTCHYCLSRHGIADLGPRMIDADGRPVEAA
jgi:hypothetical protein